MKRDWELLRNILLHLEEQGNGMDYVFFPIPGEMSISHAAYFGHVRLLEDAGYVSHVHEDRGYLRVGVMCITWSGYEFLETVRDLEIWNKTKKATVELKNFGLDTIKSLAKGYLKQKIKQQTGLDVE